MKTRLLKDAIKSLLADRSLPQKANYTRYLFSKKAEVLNYRPLTLSIVATERCTLSCDMCPTHSRIIPKTYAHIQQNDKDMSFGLFEEIIDRYSTALNVQIIGSGEPMLNKDFFKMVEYAAGKKMTVKTFSNGTTISQNTDSILSSKLEGVTISINGHNSKEFNRMTGMPENVYHEVYEAVKALIRERNRRKSKVRVKLSYIIDKENYVNIPEMAKVSMDLGADHTFFCNFLACPYDGFRAEERVLEKDEAVIAKMRGFIEGIPAEPRKKFDFPLLVDRNATGFNCDCHFSQIRFDGNGNISSCSMMLLNMYGNGSYDDNDAWNNTFFRSMRKRFLSGDKSQLFEQCLWCPDNVGVYPWK